jgi:hypothetical protein
VNDGQNKAVDPPASGINRNPCFLSAKESSNSSRVSLSRSDDDGALAAAFRVFDSSASGGHGQCEALRGGAGGVARSDREEVGPCGRGRARHHGRAVAVVVKVMPLTVPVWMMLVSVSVSRSS